MKKLFSILSAIILISLSGSAMAEEKKEDKPRHKWVGLQGDLGVPDGAAAGIVVSPYFYWLKVTGSYTNNYFASGGRAGVTLDPIKFGVGLTFTTEYGFTGKLNPSDLVGEKLPDTTYQYVNFHPGLEFGSPNGFRFFLRAGPTHLWATSRGFNDVLNSDYITASEPRAKVWLTPTFKLGFTALIF
jgi:hypothetical protein